MRPLVCWVTIHGDRIGGPPLLTARATSKEKRKFPGGKKEGKWQKCFQLKPEF